MGPTLLSCSPMEVGNRGGKVEVQLEVSLERAHTILRACGKVPMICYHPYAGDEPNLILTHRLWVDLPT